MPRCSARRGIVLAAGLALAACGTRSGGAHISLTTAVEESVPVQPGDLLTAGYTFLLSAQDPATTVMVDSGSVRIDVTCPDGTNQSVLIPLPTQMYDVPAHNVDWIPSSESTDPSVWQGQAYAPDDLCGGQQGVASMVEFSAQFASSETGDSFQVRFHYAVQLASGVESPDTSSWSGQSTGILKTPAPGTAAGPDAGTASDPDAGAVSPPDAGSGSSSDAGSPPPMCTPERSMCSGMPGECCSGLTCQWGYCLPAPACSMNGDPCRASSDCCSGLTCQAGTCAPSNVCATPTQISISGTMEKSIEVLPGDVLMGGYDLSIPGNNQPTTVAVTNATVTVLVTCADKSTAPLVMNLSDKTFTIPAGNTTWFPTGDQMSPLAWQGGVTAPSGLCGGAGGHAPLGATFNAGLSSSNSQQISVRFHYASWTLGSPGVWSATKSYAAQCN